MRFETSPAVLAGPEQGGVFYPLPLATAALLFWRRDAIRLPSPPPAALVMPPPGAGLVGPDVVVGTLH